jgi:hypothetical protein
MRMNVKNLRHAGKSLFDAIKHMSLRFKGKAVLDKEYISLERIQKFFYNSESS